MGTGEAVCSAWSASGSPTRLQPSWLLEWWLHTAGPVTTAARQSAAQDRRQERQPAGSAAGTPSLSSYPASQDCHWHFMMCYPNVFSCINKIAGSLKSFQFSQISPLSICLHWKYILNAEPSLNPIEGLPYFQTQHRPTPTHTVVSAEKKREDIQLQV